MFTMINQLLWLLKTLFSESICSLCLKRIAYANIFAKNFAKKQRQNRYKGGNTYVLKWETHSSKNICMFA